MSLEKAAQDFFRENFDEDPDWISVAPGRVNLIGEHTDYSLGYVFPAAIDLRIAVAARRANGRTRLASKDTGRGEPFDARSIEAKRGTAWTNYPAGVAWALREFGLKSNLDAAVVANLPRGAGVSSSAAIELAFAVLWNQIDELGLSNKQLATSCVKAENEFVKLSCGMMDQMASALGKADHAMLLDTRSTDVRYEPIPTELQIVLCNTRCSRKLESSEYNKRVATCKSAAAKLGVSSLREVSQEDFERGQASLNEEEIMRARHVVGENLRCLEFAKALAVKDLARMGRLMRASHESLRDDYEVSSPELDAMAESAWSAPGCVGARLTGAGFGGSCVALVHANEVDAFISEVDRRYRERVRLSPKFTACRAVNGARASRI